MSQTFKLAFFSSSEFTIPILQDILAQQEKPLLAVFQEQLEQLSKENDDFCPDFWHSKEQILELAGKEPMLQNPVKLTLVVTQPDRLNRGKVLQNPIAAAAHKYTLPLFQPEKINRELEQFQSLCPDLDFALVASFGQILSSQVLESSRWGFLNWHPSALPQYRGATPMQFALKNGDTKTALSWIEMTKEMDAGDIWLQIDQEIGKEETLPTLAEKMGLLGAKTWSLPLVAKILNQKSQP